MIQDVTAVIPIHEDGNRDWLNRATSSLPTGMRYLVAENTGEIGAALTEAARDYATTEWLLLMGADDAWQPGSLEYMFSFTRVQADVVYPSMLLTDVDMTEITGVWPAEEFCGNRLQTVNYVPGCGFIRRSKYLEVGGTRDLDGLEDWDLWVRMYRAGARFKACPDAYYLYRQNPEGRNKLPADEIDATVDRLKAEIVGEEPEIRATFYAQATPATTYLRCILPARHLPGQSRGESSVATIAHGDRVEGPDDVDVVFPNHRGSAAVFQFAGDKMSALITQSMITEGIRVLVEVDDNYLTTASKDIRKRAGWEKHIGDGMHSLQGHKWIVENADGVICATDYLAGQYRKVAKEVFVCPNTVDPADWPDPAEPGDVFRIGWYASLSHGRDIPLITRALEWASRQPGVEVTVLGIDPKWKFPYRHLGWATDLAEYREFFQWLDVHVCPIVATPWSLGRSDIKALESLMGAAWPIVSDVEPYASLEDGENCLKARDAKAFYEHVKWCVGNRDEVRSLAAKGREWVLRNRTTASMIHLWEEALAL